MKAGASSMLLACFYIHSAAQPAPLFTAVHASVSNVTFRNVLTESVDMNIISYEYFFNGGGVAVGDINNDGLADLFFTGNMVENKLYLNRGGLRFEDVTQKAGVAGHAGWKTGAALADLNGDGWLDIYVCYSGRDSLLRNNELFINQQNLTFKDEARQRGAAFYDYSTQAAFLDYDRDGDLDIYLLNHNIKFFRRLDASALKSQRDPNAGDRLLRNDDGRFTDVTGQSGISGNPISFGLGVAVSDFNLDGWPDIYVSNDYTEQDYCYINNGNGTFSDRLEGMMGHVSQFSMGCDAADFNNDGLSDLITLDMLPPDNYRQKLFFVPDNYEMYRNMVENRFYHQLMRNMLQLNNGDGTFSEIGQLAGVSNTDWSWAPLFADFDNDGWKDLLVTNGYLRDLINMDFQKFYADERLKAASGERNDKILQMLRQVPSTPLRNYLFRNNGDLTFTDVSAAWGFGEKDFSNGAAFADLDNDGDLDIILNRLNETSVIYENKLANSDYLKIEFSSAQPNQSGVGASVSVYQGGMKQYQEFYPSRGFQSSMHVPLHFGIRDGSIDSVVVIWPHGKMQRLYDVQPNRILQVRDEEAGGTYQPPPRRTGKEIFRRVAPPIRYVDEEDSYNDFKQQPLMPNMISYAGPRCAIGDINGDGLDDYYFCGPKNHPGKLFIQGAAGTFFESKQSSFDRDMAKHDAQALFFDVDSDGDKDLYVVSGGYQFLPADTLLQDRLYINSGGNFVRNRQALPAESASGSCAVAADIDGDGDEDLFVGGRVLPGRYPQSPESFILINDGEGNFTNETERVSPGLSHTGMVTDAVWIDLNGDKQSDLVLAGEWMPIRFFINRNGHLEDESEKFLRAKSSGWWNRICAADFDGDGDTDLVAGNTGLNIQLKATMEKPVLMRYADFDANGVVDPFIFSYVMDTLRPLASRDEALDQVISLRKKFTDYKSYAKASISDLLTPDQLSQAKELDAVRFETSYLENKGGHFEFRELPEQAQFAPVCAMASLDFDGDGFKDLVLGGNVQHVRIRFGKADANYLMLFKGDGRGGFRYIPQPQSGLSVRGDVRDLVPVKTAAGTFLLVAINQQPLQCYQLAGK